MCCVLNAGSISVITNDGKHIVVSHCLPRCPRMLGGRAVPKHVFRCACAVSWVVIAYFCWEQGTLKGFDQATNIVLENCHERVYSTVAGVEQIVLGLYIIRGDNMYVRWLPGSILPLSALRFMLFRVLACPVHARQCCLARVICIPWNCGPFFSTHMFDICAQRGHWRAG